ncbi:uncharacterized protein LOC143974669 [Lithobates pipiens]
MDGHWKEQIRRLLIRRDQLQLGNYGKLVESYIKLLDKQEEALQREHTLHSKTEQQEGKLISSQKSNREVIQNTGDCSCCGDSQRLKEEVETLLNRLGCMEREHEKLLSRLLEDKKKEAQRMNQINEKIDRYQRRKVKTYQVDHN